MNPELPPHADSPSAAPLGSAAAGAAYEVPLVEQAKSDIRAMAAEIASLATARLSPTDFYEAFLPRVRTAMAAEAAAIWWVDADGRPWLEAHQGLPPLLRDGKLPSPAHATILTAALADGQPVLVPPRTATGPTKRPTNPLSDALLLVPLQIDQRYEYLLEVVQSSTGGPSAQRGYLRFLTQMGEILADWVRRWRLRELAEQRRRSELAERRLLEVASADAPHRAAQRAADGCIEQFDADVALLLARGLRCRVLAIGGAPPLDPRSEAVCAARELVTVVRKSKPCPPVRLVEATERRGPPSAGAEGSPPPSTAPSTDSRLQLAVDRLAEVLRCRCFLLVNDPDAGGPWLILGYCDTAQAAEIARALERETSNRDDGSGGALFLAALQRLVYRTEASGFPWRPRAGGQRLSAGSGGRFWTRFASWSVAAALLGGVACFPVSEQVSATAVLTPQSKLVYYAPQGGMVDRVWIEEGQAVVPGAPLVHITSRQLDRQIAALDGEIDVTSKTLESARWLRNRSDHLSEREVDRLESEIRQLEATLNALQQQWQLLQEQSAELEVRAIAPGRVLTWNASQRLSNRPVAAGQPLVATFDPDGTWQLEVSIPDHRAGIVSRALQARGRALPCQVVFTSHPERIVPAELTTTADLAIRLPNADHQQVVPAIARVARENLPIHKDGAVARVVIHCGRTSLGWLVCRDAFWSLSSWFRMLW